MAQLDFVNTLAFGMVLAVPMGTRPLFGVLGGSPTLTGGPAIGLAFAPALEFPVVPTVGLSSTSSTRSRLPGA